MKKIIYIVLAAVFLTSCEGDPGRPGRDGRDGEDGAVTYKKIVYFDVPQEAWQYSGDDMNNFFYATIDMPEITEEVFNYGIVKTYQTFDFNPKTQSWASQIELPYSLHSEEEINPNEWVFYTETVNYEYYVGSITIYYTASDFQYEVKYYTPGNMYFRCVAIY